MKEPTCELCALAAAGTPLYRDARLMVVLVDEPDYPGFCRVIWNAHVREMSALDEADRLALMQVVWRVERAVLDVMVPHKVNLASLGNMTPHLHWHVIPRYLHDAHFPTPVWGPPQRASDPEQLAARRALLPALAAAITRSLSTQLS
ncbi:MAG: HIT family protein [Pseudomonadota bacterium]